MDNKLEYSYIDSNRHIHHNMCYPTPINYPSRRQRRRAVKLGLGVDCLGANRWAANLGRNIKSGDRG